MSQAWLGSPGNQPTVILLLRLSWDLPWLVAPQPAGTEPELLGTWLALCPLTLRCALMHLAENFPAHSPLGLGVTLLLPLCDLREVI